MKLTSVIKTLIFLFLYINANGQYNSWDGSNDMFLNPHGEYRAMNIFVNIVYDNPNDTIEDPYPGSNYDWPQATTEGVNQNIPNYFVDLFDTTNNTNPHGTFTRLFSESSFNDLFIIGDYMVVNINRSDINGGDQFELGDMPNDVFSFIYNHGGYNAILGHSDSDDYDSDNEDGVDFCNIYVRNTIPNYGGYAGNGLAASDGNINMLMQDGYSNVEMITISSVGPRSGWVQNPTYVAFHEFSHLLFGSNAFHTSGGNHFGTENSCTITNMGLQGGYGLMGSHSSGLVSCNGYERWRMHWKDENYNNTNSFIAANNIPSDITGEDGDMTFILRDFITTGDAIRIKLPNAELDEGTPLPDKSYNTPHQYLWLENHKIGMNNKLDFMQFKEYDCRPEGQPGVYAYIQVGKDDLSGSETTVWPDNETDNLIALSAEGNYDYKFVDMEDIPCVTNEPYASDSVKQPNPFNGFNDLMTHIYDRDNNDTIQAVAYGDDVKMVAKKYYLDGTYNDSLIYLYDMYDAFTDAMEMNMGTNPAPVNTITYHVQQYQGNIIPVSESRNARYIDLTGLSIKFVELANNDMKVIIKWDDYYIDNDCRWTGNILLSERIILSPGNSIVLDQNLSPNQYVRDSVSNEFSEISKFYCLEGSSFTQKTNSEVVVKNKSELLIQTGAEYTIQEGAELTIKSGSKLKIEKCANFIVKKGGKLTIEPNATICIEDQALVSLENPACIDLQAGFSNGGCLPVTSSNIHYLLNIPEDHSITGNIRWDHEDLTVLQDIVVEDSGVLQLNSSSLSFVNGARIVVKPGGKLDVSRTTLTSGGCGIQELWPGIQVWGNADYAQLPPYHQGTVIIDSTSTISNAEIGVLAYGDDDIHRDGGVPVYGPSGGIVQVKNTHFKNNQVAARFGAYPFDNISYFDECHFETTDTLLQAKVPDYFVYLSGVKGISMDSCIFENSSSTEYFGNGIYCVDSHFELDGNCTDNYNPCEHFEYSKMENLMYAIVALEKSPDKYVDIRHTRFINNYKGVLLSGINDARFTSNIIEVPLLQTGMEDSYGLYLDNCNRYHVENNEFISTSPAMDLGNIGMYILNSGPYYNIVYNNQFTSLGYGIMAVGENRNGTDDGLCFKCNDFDGVETDILVTPEDGGPTGNNIGIAHYQGSMAPNDTAAAGNTFTENQSVLEYNLDNSYGAEFFNYYYHGDSPDTVKVKPEPVNDSTTIHVEPNNQATYTKDTSCPSHLHNGGEPIDEIRSTMETSSQEASQTEATLQTLVDDGNTQQLNFEVLSSLPFEAQQLYLDLMSKSPYLSDTVLKSSAVKEDVLTDMLIRDVMVSNPQSAKEDEVIQKLENRDEPLPDYMLAQIMAGLDSIGAKEILERELAGHRTRRQSAYRDLHRIFKTDTAITGGSDSLMNLLQEEPDVNAKYELAFMHLDREEYGQAQSVVNSIPGQFELTEEQATEQADFTQLIDLLIEADQDSLLFPSFDSAHIAELNEIENNDNGMAAVYARNSLVAAGEMDWREPVYIPVSNKSSEIIQDDDTEKIDKSILEVYPNPAKEYITAEYHLDEFQTGQLVIVNTEGKMVRQIPLKYAEDKVSIDLKPLSNGVYLLKLSANGKRQQTVKFSIVK